MGPRNNNKDTQGEIMNLKSMTKAQLEEYGRTIGIELDRRKTKKDLIAELNKATKKKAPATKKAPAKKATAKKKAPATKKAPAKIVGKPVKKANLTPSATKPVAKRGVWASVKKFLGL